LILFRSQEIEGGFQKAFLEFYFKDSTKYAFENSAANLFSFK